MEFYLAEVINFYVPRKHKKQQKFVPERLRGKLLKFPAPPKEIPEEVRPTLSERIQGILISDKRRIYD
jgi:hypothetical protein